MMFIMRVPDTTRRERLVARTKPMGVNGAQSAVYKLSGSDCLAQVTLRMFRDVDQQPEDGGGQPLSAHESWRIQPRNVDVP
jgi:hypothetical protein